MSVQSHARILGIFFLCLGFVTLTSANVEKVIFMGPEPINIPLQKPTISDLNLHVLTPNPVGNTLRTSLPRQFQHDSTDEPPPATWLLLDSLAQGQRYELRVSWAAIEPTNFALDVYEPDTVWQTPDLIQSLARYTASVKGTFDEEQEPFIHRPPPESVSEGEKKSSLVLLRITAAADYFTHDTELMRNPPPVLTDITLDPFLYNVLPRSLLPTVGYLLVVAVITSFVARWVASFLQSLAGQADTPQKKRQ